MPPIESWEPPVGMTARELCALEPPNSHPLLGSPERGPLILPGWRVVVGGQSGGGKTTLCMRIIRSVVLGDEFLEWKGYGGRALVLDLEQGLRTVQRRLNEAGLDQSEDVDYFRIPDGLGIDQEPEQREWLDGLLRHGHEGRGRYDIVLVDPLYKLYHGEGDERGMIDLMRHLDRWREEMGFALLLPAHLRKTDTTGRRKLGMDDISGSGAIVRGAEVVIGVEMLSRLPESGAGFGKSRLHWWKDRDGDLPVGQKWQLSFRPEVGYSIDESVVKTTMGALTECLARSWPDPLTVRDIAERIGRSERTVERKIRELRQTMDLTESVGAHGKIGYRLTEVYDPEEEGWE